MVTSGRSRPAYGWCGRRNPHGPFGRRTQNSSSTAAAAAFRNPPIALQPAARLLPCGKAGQCGPRKWTVNYLLLERRPWPSERTLVPKRSSQGPWGATLLCPRLDAHNLLLCVQPTVSPSHPTCCLAAVLSTTSFSCIPRCLALLAAIHTESEQQTASAAGVVHQAYTTNSSLPFHCVCEEACQSAPSSPDNIATSEHAGLHSHAEQAPAPSTAPVCGHRS